MSSAATKLNPPVGADAGIASRTPSIGRLTGVELRKMVDTRAGFWMLTSTALLTLIVAVALALTNDPESRSLADALGGVIQPSSILLPIIGVLLVASEWSQRTTLSTFALVPNRGRVIIAKLLAGIGISVIASLLCLALSVATTAVGGGPFELGIEALFQTFLYLAISIAIGIAFGAAWLIPAAAIVLIFALPFAIAALGSLEALKDIGMWIDQSRTLAPLVEDSLSGKEWARVAATAGVWFGIPMVIGAWRITRSEIN